MHDEQGNGLWCDVGCSNDSARDYTASGCMTAWWSTVTAPASATRTTPTKALFENNELHGNGKTERRGGIDIRDSQNASGDQQQTWGPPPSPGLAIWPTVIGSACAPPIRAALTV